MLYKFRDGINYLTFADKCEMSCVPIRVQKKNLSMVQIIWVLCGEFFKIPYSFLIHYIIY